MPLAAVPGSAPPPLPLSKALVGCHASAAREGDVRAAAAALPSRCRRGLGRGGGTPLSLRTLAAGNLSRARTLQRTQRSRKVAGTLDLCCFHTGD